MSNKQNDFIAAHLHQPDASLEDLYAHGITPENTGIKERDEYKKIEMIKEKFSDKEGKFDEKLFDTFYDNMLLIFNEYQNRDFSEKAIDVIETSPLDWTNLGGKKYDTDAIVHITNLPNKYTMGLGNIWEIGTPTFSDAEIAQTKNVLDENGKELDYTPHDKRGGFFKGLLREPMALAIWEEDGTHMENGVEVSHKKGDIKLDEEGDARYQLLGNKSSAGRQMLRYWDTATIEGSWINKYDFMDSDGLRKSTAGVVAKTAFQIVPYFIPYVGVAYKWAMLGKELGTAMPMLLQSINTAVGGSEDSEFGQAMNVWSNRMNSYKSGMSQRGQSKFFSLENIGNIVASSVGQLYQQRAIASIPKLLKQTGKVGTAVGRQSALTYMALTSGQDAYNSFKEAGASEQVAGIGALASMGALYGLMNIGYFEDWLFKGTWLDENRVLNETLKQSIKDKKVAWKFIDDVGNVNPSKAREIFNNVKNGIGETWNKVFTVAGTTGRSLSEVVGRSLNESIEEVMEEMSTDAVKGIFSGLEALGVNMTDGVKNLDFGFSVEDIATRYGGAFVGGGIGGAVFGAVDGIENKIKGGKSLIDLDTRSRLLWFLRNGHGNEIRKEIDRLYKKGKLGNKNLSATKSVNVEDLLNNGDGNVKPVFQEGTETDNQNLLVYRAMMDEINSLEHFLTSNRFKLSDKELLAKMLKLDLDEKARNESIKNLDNPLINKIIELGLADAVTNDVQYLLTQLDDKGVKIVQKRNELANSTPDGPNKNDSIENNQELKTLQKEYDQIKETIDEILAGEHADYYVEYGLMLADKEFNKYFIPGDDSIAYSEIANYYWLKEGKSYSDLSEDEQNKVKTEYEAFKSLDGYSAQRQRFELFRSVNERYSEVIQNSAEALKNVKYDPDFDANIYGNLSDRLSKLETRSKELTQLIETEEDVEKKRLYESEKNVIDKDYEIFNNLNKNISLERIRIADGSLPSMKRFDELLSERSEIYENLLRKQEEITNLGKTPDLTVMSKLMSESEELNRQIESIESNMFDLRETVKSELLGNYQTWSEKQILKFDDDLLVKTAVPFLINTKLSDKQLNNNVIRDGSIVHNVSDYKTFITNVINDPLNVQTHYDELVKKLVKLAAEDGFDISEQIVKQTVNKMLNNLDTELLQLISEINAYKSTLPKTPLNNILQNLHVEIAGKPLEILKMLEMEKERYISAKQVDEYIMSHGEIQEKEVYNALRLLNVITAAIDAASNGYNIEANKFRNGEGKVKLAELSDNVTEVYKKEILTLKQRLTYLKELSEKNNAAQAKKQFDIMLHVEPMFIKSILNKKDLILKELKIDVEQIWNNVSEDVTLENLTLETHPKFKHAKIKFETEVFKQTNGKFSTGDLAKSLFNVYKSDDTLWGCDSGEFNDSMESFNSYVELLYLMSIVSSNTTAFSGLFNKNVLNSEAYSKYTPFYSQEFTIRCTWAQMKNKELYNEMLTLFKTQVPADKKGSYLKDLFSADNILFVTGGPGTGKSSAVGLAIKLLAEAEGGKVIGVAKFGQQVDGLKTNLQTTDAMLFSEFENSITDNPDSLYDNDASRQGHVSNVNNVDLSAQLEMFDKIDGPKILMIDEFTFFTEGEIQLLSKYAKKHNLLVIGLGDPKQNQVTITGSGKASQTGYEDTIMFMTPALTVSMRVGNVAKDLNTTKLDTILSKCIHHTKTHRSEGVSDWNTKMIDLGYIPKNIEFSYSDDKDGFFGDIYQTFTSETKLDTVKRWIEKLKAEGKTIVIITDDDAFNSLEKSVDRIIDPFNVQGAEYDYAIVVKKDWSTNRLGGENNAFLFLRDLLTMSSRSRIGTVILADENKAHPFKNLVTITSKEHPGGKIIVNSDSDSRLKAITEKFNAYLKDLYKDYGVDEEVVVKEKSIQESEKKNNDDKKYMPDDEKLSENQPVENVTLEEVLDAYNQPLTDENSWLIRKSDYDKYNHRVAELENSAFIHADTDKLVNYLFADEIDLYKKGSLLYELDPKNENLLESDFINGYKKYLQIISSIILYRPDDADLTTALDLANQNVDRSDLVVDEFVSKVENAIRDIDNEGYFYVTEFKPNENIIYYVTDDFYIPISIVTNMTPGVYKNVKFSETTGVIGLSSKGNLHVDLKDTVGNSVFMGQKGGVFSPDDSTKKNLREENEDFKLSNIGKSAVFVTYKPWLSPENVFRFNVTNGVRDYTISHQHEVKLVDIQKRIDFQTFIQLCKHKRYVLRGNMNSDLTSDSSSDKDLGFDKSIDYLAKFLNISSVDINTIRNKPAVEEADNYKNWTNVAYTSTEILTPQTLNHLISVITNYYLSKSDKDTDKVLSNILNYIKSIGGYRSNVRHNQYNTKGFSIRLYKDEVDRPPHSVYDDFFFECVNPNEYVIYKNTYDEDIRDYEYVEIGKFDLVLNDEEPYKFFINALDVISKTYSSTDVLPRAIVNGVSEESFMTTLANNDFSLILGTKADLYENDFTKGESPTSDNTKIETRVYPLIDFDVVFELLDGINLNDTTELEEYFKANSMLKNNLYVSMRGGEYYGSKDGRNQFNISAHKKLEITDGVTSDYVKFIAPLFRVYKSELVNEIDPKNYSYLDSVFDVDKEPIIETVPVLYKSETFELIGDEKSIKIKYGEKLTDVLWATVVGMSDTEMWVDSQMFKSPVRIPGNWENKVPKPLHKGKFVFKSDDMYFYKVTDGGFSSYDVSSNTVEHWISYNGVLLNIKSGTTLADEDVPLLSSLLTTRFGIYPSSDLKVDQNGRVVEGNLSITKELFNALFKSSETIIDIPNKIDVVELNFTNNSFKLNVNGEIIERFVVDDSVSDLKTLFGLNDFNFVKSNVVSETELFKNRLLDKISKNNNLQPFKEEIEKLIVDDIDYSIDQINMFLDDHKLKLGSEYTLEWKNKKIQINKTDTHETIVAQLLNANNLSFDNIQIIKTDDNNIVTCNSIEFLLYLSNNSQSGILTKENGKWKMNLFVNSDLSKENVTSDLIYEEIFKVTGDDFIANSTFTSIVDEIVQNGYSSTYNNLSAKQDPLFDDERFSNILDMIDELLSNQDDCNIIK